MLRALDIPPLWTLLHMAAATLLAAAWSPLGPESIVIGGIVIAGSLALMVWAALTMARARTPVLPHQEPEALVTSGPFRWSRNPIYIADLGLLLGWAIALGQPLAAVLLWPLHYVLLKRFVLGEEGRLGRKFGPAFHDYAAAVPRWL